MSVNKWCRIQMRIAAGAALFASPFTTPNEAKLASMLIQLLNEIECPAEKTTEPEKDDQ
jgi:hypothetical protein